MNTVYRYGTKRHGGDSYLHLRSAAGFYRKRYGAMDSGSSFEIGLSISERPSEAANRERIGGLGRRHWCMAKGQ